MEMNALKMGHDEFVKSLPPKADMYKEQGALDFTRLGKVKSRRVASKSEFNLSTISTCSSWNSRLIGVVKGTISCYEF